MKSIFVKNFFYTFALNNLKLKFINETINSTTFDNSCNSKL